MSNGLERVPAVPTKLPEIPALTGLRLFAALFVVLAHTFHFGPQDTFAEPWGSIYNYISTLSALGMSLFFVLSGFVIHYNYRDAILSGGPVGLWNFIVARFARLYPLFILVIAADMWRSGQLGQVFGASIAAREAATRAAPFYFTLTQSWFYDVIGQNNLIYQFGFVASIAWSISTEFFFYVSYPLLCVLTAAAPRVWMKVIASACVCALAIASIGFLINHATQIDEYGARYYGAPAGGGGQDSLSRWTVYFAPYSRIFEFILGVLACDIFLRLSKFRPGKIESFFASFVTVAALGALMVEHLIMFHPKQPFPIFTQFHKSFGYAMPVAILLFTTARYQTFLAKISSWRPIVAGGEISYSIYLFHILLLDAGARAGLWSLIKDPHLTILFRIALEIAAVLPVAWISYRVFEVPSRVWLRRALSWPIKPRQTKLWMQPLLATTRASILGLVVLVPMGITLFSHPTVKLPPAEGTIDIIEATYGGSCGAKQGNTSKDVTEVCAGRSSCSYLVDVYRIGDPASGCAKDFAVKWRCGSDQVAQQTIVPGEAGLGGHRIVMMCRK